MNEDIRNFDAGRNKRSALTHLTGQMDAQRLQQAVTSSYVKLKALTQRLIRGEAHQENSSQEIELPQRGASTFVVLPRDNHEIYPHWLIELLIPKATTHAYGIELAGDVVLGVLREGYKRPDLDLGLYGGDLKGVSGHHAMLSPKLNSLLLVDLQSTNGTWLNNTRLDPHSPSLITTGDVISLGTLAFVMHITSAPYDLGDVC